MSALPITHITLYKHGVGFFERRAQVDGEEVILSFRVAEMNDILKSLTAVDWGGGQVLGIDYATPQSREERLAGCSIRLGDRRSARDLLIGLRGRRVTLARAEAEPLTGTLVGVDEPPERHPLDSALVSLLLDGAAEVLTIPLSAITGVDIRDDQGAADLRFFLETALTQDEYRRVTVRLTPGDHDLSVSYIAPAPTWRISYRMLIEEGKALLLGWGIFDNRLEEDLKGISLSLVAGMPISFVYDLYTPFTPERPVVEEEQRVAAAPVAFGGARAGSVGVGRDMEAAFGMAAPAMAAPPSAPMRQAMRREDLAAAQTVATTGESLGELFQYVIQTPVTVGRGQSAMVPVVSANLDYHKDLLYNGRKLPEHPVATLRMKNASGLTLERGPVTVLDGGEYVGEAVLPFTASGAEIVVPYAVELSLTARESSRSSRETRGLNIKDGYVHFEEWDIRLREYRLSSKSGEAMTVLVEHPRAATYDLFDTPAPKETTDDHVRFEVEVAAWGEAVLTVKERRLIRRREELHKQSHHNLQAYLRQGLIDRRVHDQVVKLLMLFDSIGDYEKKLAEITQERKSVYKAQQQIQGNLGALGQSAKERGLRDQYVDRLQATETQLRELERRESELKANIRAVENDIVARIKALG
ncbi:MAG: hypothetical protein ACLFTI_13135 [Anaerolineales bacterium]